MLEPDLYIFKPEGDGGKLEPQGPAKLEWQTPREFLESTALSVMETVEWGQTKVRFARLPENWPDSDQYYALVERFEDDGRPNPQWALVMVSDVHFQQFKDIFKEFCEQ